MKFEETEIHESVRAADHVGKVKPLVMASKRGAVRIGRRSMK
jgi:hypothetical protein